MIACILERNRDEKSSGKKRLAYTLAAGAAVVAGHVNDAGAEVVYSGTADLTIYQGNSLFLYLDNDSFKDVLLKNYVFTNGNYQGIYLYYPPGKIVGFQAGPSNFSYASALTAGTVVDSTTPAPTFVASLSYGSENPNGEFDNITNGYIGLSFPIGGGTVNELHYGWLRVDINNEQGSFVVRDWAYESVAGAGIIVGDMGVQTIPGDFDNDSDVDGRDFLIWQRGFSPQSLSTADLQDWQENYGMAPPQTVGVTAVPEPVTLGMLAAGSVGVLLLRRLRNR